MITSFRRLVLAVLIGTGFLFSGTMVIPEKVVAQGTKEEKKKKSKKKKKTEEDKKG